MKRVLLLAIAFCCVPVLAVAQDMAYQFERVFPDSTTMVNSAHGLAVDADGKVWIQPYYASNITDAVGSENFVRVFNSDGTEADFSPIIDMQLGTEDLMLGLGTGLSTDHEGNVIVAMHGVRYVQDDTVRYDQTRSYIVRFDRNDGSVLSFRDVTVVRVADADPVVVQAPNRAAVDGDGNIFVSFVWPGAPLLIIDPTMAFEHQRIPDLGPGFARTLAVSEDGTRIYDVRDIANNRVWGATSVFDDYSVVDTTWAENFNPGAAGRDPSTGNIWVAADGTGNDPSAIVTGAGNNPRLFHLLDWQTGDILQSFEWNYQPQEAYRPQRSLAASPDGQYVYVGTFATGVPAVQRFELRPVNIEQDSPEIPAGYALEQNYPNPFNPSTTFRFEVADAGHVHLAVYDVLGREVEVLANEFMPAGGYTATFEASPSLPSGTYFYVLEANGQRMTQKMVLLK